MRLQHLATALALDQLEQRYRFAITPTFTGGQSHPIFQVISRIWYDWLDETPRAKTRISAFERLYRQAA